MAHQGFCGNFFQGSDDESFSSASEAFFGQVKWSPSEGVLVTWGRLGKHAGIQFMVSLVCLLSSRLDVVERKNSTGDTVFPTLPVLFRGVDTDMQ